MKKMFACVLVLSVLFSFPALAMDKADMEVLTIDEKTIVKLKYAKDIVRNANLWGYVFRVPEDWEMMEQDPDDPYLAIFVSPDDKKALIVAYAIFDMSYEFGDDEQRTAAFDEWMADIDTAYAYGDVWRLRFIYEYFSGYPAVRCFHACGENAIMTMIYVDMTEGYEPDIMDVAPYVATVESEGAV